MKKQFWTLLTVVFLLAGMNVAVAQSKSSMSFSVPFPFKVGETTFTAGVYRLTFDGGNSRNLQLVNTGTRQTQFVRFITRLSSRSEGKVVFDTVKQERYLSEVYMGGTDGFQILGTPEDHGHEVAEARTENP
ncbi:MAG: hypothetical protein WAO20_02465 [Acidobacteriota bacterium]